MGTTTKCPSCGEWNCPIPCHCGCNGTEEEFEADEYDVTVQVVLRVIVKNEEEIPKEVEELSEMYMDGLDYKIINAKKIDGG